MNEFQFVTVKNTKPVSTVKEMRVAESAVRSSVAQQFPGWIVEGVNYNTDDEWDVRLARFVRSAGPPPFMKDKEEESDDSEESDDESDDSEDSDDDSDDDGDSESKDEGPTPDKVKDPKTILQNIVKELQTQLMPLFDKADKLDEVHETIKDHVADPLPDMPMEDVGPVPGGGPSGPGGKMPAPMPAPRGPRGPGAAPKRPPMGPPTFTHRRQPDRSRRSEIYTLLKSEASSLQQAVALLEEDPKFKGYKVVNVADKGETFEAVIEQT